MEKRETCIVCDRLVSDTSPLSKTHLIPNALGGRLKPQLACMECNTQLNDIADMGLVQSLSCFAKQLDVKRDRGDHPPMEGEDANGTKYFLEPGTFAPSLAEPYSKIIPLENGDMEIEILAPDHQSAMNELYRQRRLLNVSFDPKVAMLNAERMSEPTGFIRQSLELGPKSVFAGALACMWLFASWKSGTGITSKPELLSRLEQAQNEQDMWYYESLPWIEGALPAFSHVLHVKNHKQTQQLIGCVSYFNVISIGAVLATNYRTELDVIYALDLESGQDVSQSLCIDQKSFERNALNADGALKFPGDQGKLVKLVKRRCDDFLEKIMSR
jgi:hypothetical protein